MDAAHQSAGKSRLQKNLQRSLAKVKLSKRGRLSLSDRNNLKKSTVTAVQGYLKSELKRTNTHTYDWYFFKEDGKVYHIEADRNNLYHNRYFVVDHVQVPIESQYAYGSTYGQQRVQQYEITSKQIGEIISSSAKIFSDMMRITVSEKEDAKIHRAYDTVDEKKIITVTIALPAAIIGAAEAIPLMVMASKSSAFSAMTSSIGKAFALNSGRQAAINGAANFTEQYLSTGISHNKWGVNNFRRIDVFDVGISAATGGFGGVFLKSEFDLTYKEGFELHDFSEFSENMAVNSLKYKSAMSFGSAVSSPLGEYAGSLGKIFGQGGQLTIKTVISTGKKSLGDEND